MNLTTVRNSNGKDFAIFKDSINCGLINHKDNSHWIATIPLPCGHFGTKVLPTFKLAKTWIGDCHSATGCDLGGLRGVDITTFCFDVVRFDLDASNVGRKFPALVDDSCWGWDNGRFSKFNKNDLANVKHWFTTSASVADKMKRFGADPNNFGHVGVIWGGFVSAACKLAPDDFDDSAFWDSGAIGNCHSWIWVALDIALWDWKRLH